MEQIESAIGMPQEGNEHKQENTKKIKIRYSLFFDGTLNNWTNIDQRLAGAPLGELTEEEKKAAKEVRSKMSEDDLKRAKQLYQQYVVNDSGDNSYDGYYTNIVKMKKYIDKNPVAPYQKVYASYIEGAGTEEYKEDELRGYAFGKGKTGVKKKASTARSELIDKVSKMVQNKNTVIELLTIDVFGFSRGAATARYFIYMSLFGADNIDNIKTTLNSAGYTVEKIEICFAGLYDTVSATGYLILIDSMANNTKSLHLDAVAHAKETVQIAAADEHRKFFSLTDIQSTGKKGRQFFLPGVHSDIGGGYRDDSPEKEVIFRGSRNFAKEDMTRLMSEGWYKNKPSSSTNTSYDDKDEIDIKVYREMHEKNPVMIAETHVRRESISNYYSRIALHLMSEYSRKHKIKIKHQLERDEDIPSEDKVLSDAVNKIKSYVKKHDALGAFTSTPDDWINLDENWLHDLRNKYFHFSARYEWGHYPRFYKGKRRRLIYAG